MIIMRDFLIKTERAHDAVLGCEGENNARTLRIKTVDDISDFASINLFINSMNCGKLTVTDVDNYKQMSIVLQADMLGSAGKKTCQIVFTNEQDETILKTNQFYMWVNSSNVTDRVYVSTKDSLKAALEALIDEGTLSDLELVTDKTLSIEDKAADGEAVGNALSRLRDAIDELTLTQAQIEALVGLLD